ncbi:MAG: hypothetical protein IRZ26_02320 [Clostridia bacterium]|nr:hypothetical protein [Clostridia bacterium]
MERSDERGAVACEDEIDLRELVATLVRRKWWIAGITLAALAVAGVLSFAVLPPTYAVAVEVAPPVNAELLDTAGAGNGVNAAIQGYAALATSDAVLVQVARDVAWPGSYSDLRKSFEVQADTNGGTLTVAARAPSAEEAYRLARSWRQAFIRAAVGAARQQLDLQIQVAERSLAGGQSALDRVKAALDQGRGGSSTSALVSALAAGEALVQAREQLDRLLALRQSVETAAAPSVLQDARLPEAPVAPQKTLNLTVALVLGLMAGVLAAFLADAWRREPETEPPAAIVDALPGSQLAGER